MTAPDWLTRRGGTLQAGTDQYSWFVVLFGKPLYRLDIRPALGGFVCNIIETANGRIVATTSQARTDTHAALADACDLVKLHLGWS